MQRKLKIIPLGGVEEIGFNCTVIEYGDQLIIVDVGLGFPLSDQYGIDYVIPNISYLKKKKDQIEGVIITHAHLDHIGGLPFVIKDLGFPEVFASKFSIELIKNKLKEHNLDSKTNIREINRDSKLVSGDFEVQFFGVNHSIPESMGVIIKTPVGNIVHTGDFKFDNSPVNEPVTDYAKLAKIGDEGVLALLSDSTNSFRTGHSKSESLIGESLEKIVKDADGRVVVATFSSLLTRLYQLIEIAQKHHRKVSIIGRSMEETVKIARKLGYIKAPDNLFVDRKKIGQLPDDKVMILATGAQGEDMAALARMTRGTHPNVEIKKGDTIILSASIIPGNDMLVQTLLDDLSQKGAYVYQNKEHMDLHSSGHGYQEDQKIMLNLVKPKFFIPVHGYQSFLYKHGQTALDEFIEASDFDLDELWGMLEEHITSVEDSEIKDFLVSIFADKEIAAKYKTRPAAEYVHHSFHGGLLEHVVEMLELAKSMRMFYKEVNYDYVIAGIILHDIGKLFELDIEGTVVQRTTEGYLIGHLVKSYEFLYEHGKDKLSDEHILNLKHIILSHHGVLEYGSPVVPATIEASMVNAVDEASTKVRIFQKILRKNENSSELFAPWDNILKTRVYRGPGALKSDDGQIMF